MADINRTYLKYSFGRFIVITATGVHFMVLVGRFPVAELILLIRNLQGDKLMVGFFTANWAQETKLPKMESQI